jgi:hypothetical protein
MTNSDIYYIPEEDKDRLVIIPYSSDHYKIIMQLQMNHKLTQLDANFISDNSSECMDLEEKGLSFTGCVNRQIVFSAGIKRIWGNVGEGWVLGTSNIWNHSISVARKIKKNFDNIATAYKFKRVQTAIRSDFGIGIRFAKWLGLTNEGLMKNYGFDGSDHYRFARIY